MVALDVLASDAELRRHVDAQTFARGHTYAREGRVERVEVAGNVSGWVVQGTVLGSGVSEYQTVVSLRSEGDQLELYAACTCPVGRDCKHAVALLVTARDRQVGPEPTAAALTGAWDDTLADLLDALDDDEAVLADGATTPFALQVELVQPRLADARRARWFGQAATSRGRLRVRPVIRGASGRWVRTGIGWNDLLETHRRLHLPPDQVAVARELLIAQRATSGHLYGATGTDLELGTFGAGLWRLLERAGQTGLPLVPGGALSSLAVATAAAVVRLDLARSDDAVSLRPGVDLDGVWTDAADVDLLGDPAHGVVLWSTGEGRDAYAVTLAPLIRPVPTALKRLLEERTALDVPGDAGDVLLASYVPRLRRHVSVGSRDGSVEVPEPVVPRLTLQVTWHDAVEVQLAWSWRYRVGATDRVFALDDPPAERGVRDPRAEVDLLAGLRLTDAQASALSTTDGRLVQEQRLRAADAIDFAGQVLPGLRASDQVEVVVEGEEPDFREAKGQPVISFATVDHGSDPNRRTDWLDLEVVVTIDHHSVGIGTLVEAITLGQDRIVLADGLWVSLDHPGLDRLVRLVGEASELHDGPSDVVRVARHRPDLWVELDELGVVDEQAARWVRAAAGLRDVNTLPKIPDPPGLTATLRPYQHEGVRWLALLWRTGLGGILADDMGLGKTVQTLALIAHARATPPPAGVAAGAPFLVVAPTSVVNTWATEAATFTPGLRVRTVTESHARRRTSLAAVAADADIVVTSYTLCRLEADAYAELPWAGLVLDEAQSVKNHQAKTYQAVRRLAMPFTLAITGTPLENNLMELWSLLSLAAPGLYPHPGRFADEVARPIERAGDGDALARLRARVRPFMLRRTKDRVAADLPPKQEQVLEVALGPRHRKVYDTHLQRERQQILGLIDEDPDKHRLAIFRSLTRLRRLSLDASLIDDAYSGIASAKVDVLVEHLHEVAAEGHRALVFSQFTGFLDRVRSRLDAERIGYSYLDGRTRRRADAIEGFKSGDDPVFLISLKAGGVGLTLTEADYCFLLDPWWNPAVEAQAVDRTHRIGQSRQVMVYRLVATDTIEEKVMELKARKGELFASVMDGEGFGSAALTADDIATLLG